MKILLDMNLSPAWVLFLADAGFECVHWSDIGDPRAADSELMEWARAHNHLVFTHATRMRLRSAGDRPPCSFGDRPHVLSVTGAVLYGLAR